MIAGLPALLLFAQAATGAPQTYGPPVPPAPKPPTLPVQKSTTEPERPCPTHSDPQSTTIIVCAPKTDGYRLPPDVVEARRLKKQGQAPLPRNPHETFADHSCSTVGPMGCRGIPTIDLLAAGMVAAKIADRLGKGQEVGSVFVTNPQTSDYGYFQQAKKEREERERAAAAKAVKDAAEAKLAKAKAAATAAAAASQRPEAGSSH
jgi:hypothetical protein